MSQGVLLMLGFVGYDSHALIRVCTRGEFFVSYVSNSTPYP